MGLTEGIEKRLARVPFSVWPAEKCKASQDQIGDEYVPKVMPNQKSNKNKNK